jgi:DNA-binding XRE family transcriptional regulator
LLKDLRERSGLGTQQLADQADVHVSFVRGIERGVQAPSVTTARPMLGCIKEQDRLQWMDRGPYDLLISDPDTGRKVAFQFKAQKKGQNRRPGSDGGLPALSKVAEAMSEIRVDPAVMASGLDPFIEAMQLISLWLAETREPGGDALAHAAGGRAQVSAPVDDAMFGRVVRMLAAADAELLSRVENLLRLEAARGQSDS